MAPVMITLPNGTSNAEVAGRTASVAELKVWAAGQCGLSPLQLGVFAASGAALEDGESLATLRCTSLQVLPLLPGGKVHGSLARAGKVRGQTPKVAKQEKRKTKTGRAKRRNQYNKRFVATVNLPGGRRRGPNANS